jgi:hypothetical protein
MMPKLITKPKALLAIEGLSAKRTFTKSLFGAMFSVCLGLTADLPFNEPKGIASKPS